MKELSIYSRRSMSSNKGISDAMGGGNGLKLMQWTCAILLLLTPYCITAINNPLPLQEMQALEELYTVTNGQYWFWEEEGTEKGIKWDFSIDESTGEYLYHPCSSDVNIRWQRIDCDSTRSSITKLGLVGFNLTGYLPNSLGNLVNVSNFIFEDNNLVGSIPDTIGQLQEIEILSFSYNGITGSFPSSITRLTKLKQMWITECFLTGTIPPEFGSFPHIEWIHLADNYFTGTIPTTVGKLTTLYAITFDYTLMTGHIPSEIGLLHERMEYLGVSNSDFSGTIPVELSMLQTTYYFFLQSNLLTGTIPPELGELHNVDFFGLSNNDLTGTIPIELAKLANMGDLYMDANFFSGTVPLGLFDNYNAMRVLRLQRNLLTGDLSGRFRGSLTALKNIDFSDNRLSGNIPIDIFELPDVQNVALSLNCFEGSLPDSICYSRNLSVLSLDGLGAAEHCKNEVKVPLTGVTVFNTLGGSVPPCVWTLPTLQVLHVTGNGLSGSISEAISDAFFLLDLSLSHNKMTGTIPIAMQHRPYSKLDLSYNKFTGTYDEWNEGLGVDAALDLEVNRLSGWFPSPRNHSSMFGVLNALRGNLFSCHYIPSEDEYSEDFTCGSENLELSLLTFVVTLGVIIVFFSVVVMIARYDLARSKFITALVCLLNHRQVYVSYLESVVASTNSALYEKVRRICYFSQELYVVSKIFLVLLGVSLITCLPIYGIKFAEYGIDDNIYTTHSYQYHWTLSIAYLKGNIPAVAIMFMWMSVIGAMTIFVVKDGPLSRFISTLNSLSRRQISTASRESSVSTPSIGRRRLTYSFIFLINALITGAVNVAYIYSEDQALSSDKHLQIRFAVAAFKVLWNMIAVPQLVKPMKTPSKIVGIELIILVFNNIVIPCLVTAFSSPSCFRGLLYPPHSVESQYDYVYCSHTHYDGNATVCQLYGVRTVYVAPLRPPFLYNNLCTSTILTSYISVYVFVYAIQLLVSMILLAMVTLVEYASLPRWLQKGMHGVFWPNHEWVVCTKPRDILKAPEIISFDILNHLAVFVTFGISSPYLALILIFSVCLKLYMWRVMIGRFVFVRSSSSSDASGKGGLGGCEEGKRDDDSLTTLSVACLPVLDTLEDCMRPIVLSSAVFFAFVCWDMAGDEANWFDSIWAPVIVLMIPLLLWSYIGLVDWMQHHRKDVEDVLLGDGVVVISQDVDNPMLESTDSSLQVSNIEMRSYSLGEFWKSRWAGKA